MSNAHTAPTAPTADRDLADLLDPEQQQTFPMSQAGEVIRRGVSGCETLSDLAAYVASHAIEAHCPVLVRITGPLSGDTSCDEADGEVLVLPARAEVIGDAGAFFDLVGYLVGELADLHYEQGLGCARLRQAAPGCARLREIAAERI